MEEMETEDEETEESDDRFEAHFANVVSLQCYSLQLYSVLLATRPTTKLQARTLKKTSMKVDEGTGFAFFTGFKYFSKFPSMIWHLRFPS